MFDFRYHALSLVGVFLALAVGLLLGVVIGDEGLVSSARDDVRRDLRSEVLQARRDADDLREDVARRQDFERQVYPDLVADRLPGQQVGLVFLGAGSDRIVGNVRDALEDTGATLRFVTVIREPPDLAAIAGRAGATRYDALDDGSGELLAPFADRAGRQLMEGGKLVGAVRPALTSSFSGDLGQLDAVVVVRKGDRALEGDEREQAATLEQGLVGGMRETDRPVVGVERTDTEPSQIGWYRDRDIASVDSVDDVAGRAALVFALAGADGAYGVKASADALLPRVVGGVSRP